jgi:hypothetical protein
MDEGVVLSVLAEHDASGASTTLRRIVSITVFVPARSIQLDLVRQAPVRFISFPSHLPFPISILNFLNFLNFLNL